MDFQLKLLLVPILMQISIMIILKTVGLRPISLYLIFMEAK